MLAHPVIRPWIEALVLLYWLKLEFKYLHCGYFGRLSLELQHSLHIMFLFCLGFFMFFVLACWGFLFGFFFGVVWVFSCCWFFSKSYPKFVKEAWEDSSHRGWSDVWMPIVFVHLFCAMWHQIMSSARPAKNSPHGCHLGQN